MSQRNPSPRHFLAPFLAGVMMHCACAVGPQLDSQDGFAGNERASVRTAASFAHTEEELMAPIQAHLAAIENAKRFKVMNADELTRAIIESFCMPVDWKAWGQSYEDVQEFLTNKSLRLNELVYLAHSGDQAALDFLKYALSEKGAAEITAPWLIEIPSHAITSPELMRIRMQGEAATALAKLGQNPEICALLESQHAEEKQRLIETGAPRSHLYNFMSSALQTMDIIRGMGFENYENTDPRMMEYMMLHFHSRSFDLPRQ